MASGFVTFWSPSVMQAVLVNHTVYRAPPVCGWPALGMLWATARSNAVCAVAQGMPRAGHPHTAGALCAVVDEHTLHH